MLNYLHAESLPFRLEEVSKKKEKKKKKKKGGYGNDSGRNEIRADGSTPIPVNPLPDLFALRIAIRFSFGALAEKRRISRMAEHVSPDRVAFISNEKKVTKNNGIKK